MYFQTRCRLKFFLLWSHVNEKWRKSKNFTNLYTTLVETLPRSMQEFFGVNLLCTFRGDVA